MPPTGLDRLSTTSGTPAAPSGGRSESVRTCVGCRRREFRSALLRIVAAGDEADILLVDPRRRLPGRGAWLHQSSACLDQAEKRRVFPRALRRPGPLDTSGVRSYFDRADEAVVSTTTDQNGSNS